MNDYTEYRVEIAGKCGSQVRYAEVLKGQSMLVRAIRLAFPEKSGKQWAEVRKDGALVFAGTVRL